MSARRGFARALASADGGVVFTGIVQDVGRIETRTPRDGDLHLRIAVDRLPLTKVVAGDSVCVQGVCLTVTALGSDYFGVDVSRETLAVTTLADLQPDAPVNLELALRLGDPLGGHLVSGHVDGIGEVTSISEEARSLRVTIAAPPALARYLARKGSVTVDGVSLTVNEAAGAEFSVNLIPHTRGVTTLGRLAVGKRINLEVDQVARYLERLVT
jgi:riboflavin synthase